MEARLKHFSLNVLVAVASLILTFTVLNTILRCNLHRLPLRLHTYLPDGIQALAQTSKNGVTPHDYILIVGDSYAAGLGDWLGDVKDETTPAFNAAHVVHESTGRDTITFNGAGGGSIRATVAEPLSQFDYINTFLIEDLEPPEQIIVYFYEGNDLNDNLKDLSKRFYRSHNEKELHNYKTFSHFLDGLIFNDETSVSARSFWFADHLLLYEFTRKMLVDVWRQYFTVEAKKPRKLLKKSGINKVVVQQQSVEIPDRLQSPALELGAIDIDSALQVFWHSLRKLSERFPRTRISVVHIPSPLTSYRLISKQVSIQTYNDGAEFHESIRVPEQHLRICAKLRKIAHDCRAEFVDATWRIRESSATSINHGPKDWKHFNKFGYKALARAVVDLVNGTPTEQGECFRELNSPATETDSL